MRTAILVLVLAGLVAAFGCSNAFDTEDRWNQPYRVVLMVSDLEGGALGGASVWIDSELMEQTTADSYTPLGSGYPSGWQDWPANYISPILYTRIDFAEDTDYIEIVIARTGYRVSRVGFDLGDVPGTFLFRSAVPWPLT